jgi:hypothetical protein
MSCTIDISHDFWKNYAKDRKDPDQRDPLLRCYHRRLWSKPLPDGRMFLLDEKLCHDSELGSFSFSSDSFLHTYSLLPYKEIRGVVSQIPPEEIARFYALASTIGGIIIYPSNKVGGKKTINTEKWSVLRDRMDLMMECVKMHYDGEKSLMSECFERYRSFFDLFGDFKGYVDFFLMQDMVTSEYEIKPLCASGFSSRSLIPENVSEYVKYKNNSIAFLNARNKRIKEWAEENLIP